MLGLLASLVVVFDPVLLRQSSHVMTEILATTLAAAAIWGWVRWCQCVQDHRSGGETIMWSLVVGAFLALAYLCRPTFLVWAVLLCLAATFVNRNGNRWGTTAAMIVFVLAAVTGWTLRNQRAMGAPIWATSHGGYTLLLANNESFYDYLERGSWGKAWDADPFLEAYQHRYDGDPREASFWHRDWQSFDATEQADQETKPETETVVITEKSDDQLCYEAAMATIARRPTTFLWSAVVRAGRFWSPIPHDVGSRSKLVLAVVGMVYLSLFALCLFSILRHRRDLFHPVWWGGWLLAFSLTGIHAVYWSNMRMRAPVVPAIAVIAVFGLLPKQRDQEAAAEGGQASLQSDTDV